MILQKLSSPSSSSSSSSSFFHHFFQFSFNNFYFLFFFLFLFSIFLLPNPVSARRTRSTIDDNSISPLEHVWSSTTVAVGDTAVLHCSFDALINQLKNGNIDWFKESPINEKELQRQRLKQQQLLEKQKIHLQSHSHNPPQKFSRKKKRNHNSKPMNIISINNNIDPNNFYYHNYHSKDPVSIATGRTLLTKDRRLKVYRPQNSALSVLIIRRVRKGDGGYYRCNLAGSSTRHKYMILNVTDSKIEAATSPQETKAKVDEDVTLWCNATGYPQPVVYWKREDRNRTLPDGSWQFWGNGLLIKSVSEYDTGVYVCYLDNYVSPVVHHKFSLIVEDNPWKLDGYKMRYDGANWFPAGTLEPLPVAGKSFLFMCETRGSPNPQPEITWYREREPISSGQNFYIIEDSADFRQNSVSSTLVIIRYGPQLEGKYVCIAKNGFRLKRQKFYISDNPTKVKLHSMERNELLRKRAGILNKNKNKNKNKQEENEEKEKKEDEEEEEADEKGGKSGDDEEKRV